MSYDVSLEHGTMSKDLGNYTYNCAQMLVKGTGKSLSELDGMKAKKAAPILREGYLYMANHPEEMKSLEPDNGWGTYSGFKGFIKEILDACEENPDATLTVS